MSRVGGVAFYVINLINFEVIVSSDSTAIWLEHFFFRCKINGHAMVFGVVYRAPNCNVISQTEKLEDIWGPILLAYDLVVLGDDFNINLCHNPNVLTDTMDNLGMHPAITKQLDLSVAHVH